MSVKGINHITLRVRSLAQSEAFYCELLGFRRVGSRPGMSFYSSGQYNHELALVEDPAFTKSASGASGFEHVAFTVENKKDLAFLYQRLIDAGYSVSQGVDHVISQSFYVRDRDGYIIELTVDTPRSDWNPHAFEKDFRLDIQDVKKNIPGPRAKRISTSLLRKLWLMVMMMPIAMSFSARMHVRRAVWFTAKHGTAFFHRGLRTIIFSF